ncbi:MAG: hypothetical protein EZS28_056281 [Streblomastix strix]|uniref:RING-type domain-containing protein n=1 Tax=Streblomastix strix TaxID=222440 RepID=A0A5J4PM92_9EUKA|nr:MAG: hypothetical protein EZS28_056281 [Streblomastix strix]
MSSPRTLAASPCMHFCLCPTCASALFESYGSKCPVCRESINELVQIDLSDKQSKQRRIIVPDSSDNT